MIELPINPKTGLRMLILRQSDLKLWLTDRRDFYFRVFENLEPVVQTVGVASIGTFVHEGLKAHYLQTMDPIMAVATLADEQNKFNPLVADALQKQAEFAQIILTGYFEWLEQTAADHGIKLLQVEDRLTALIGVFGGIEVYVTGQPDIVMEDDHGLIWIIDHKTVDSFAAITSVLDVDFQGQTYDFLLRANSVNSIGFRHNQLRRVKRTGTAKPPFYNRTEVVFNDHQRSTHKWHLEGLAEEIVGRYLSMESAQATGDEQVIQATFHRCFQPYFTTDSTWRSNFLTMSKLYDTDPEAAQDMKEMAYKQQERLAS